MTNGPLRIAVSDIREVIADPKSYRKQLESSSSQPRRFSKMQCVRLACYRFHKPNEDINSALDYLEKMFIKNFVNTDDLADHLMMLEEYVQQFLKSGNTAIACRERMMIELPSEFVGRIRVSGETSRIDLTDGGYAVWMIGHSLDNWQQDPRFPVLQAHYAKKLGAGLSEVSVGVYDFKIGKHESEIFAESVISTTLSELENALKVGFR
jgi:hypothetical protein